MRKKYKLRLDYSKELTGDSIVSRRTFFIYVCDPSDMIKCLL